MSKIWHKPLHTRKVWKRMSLINKSIYYLQPFLVHLFDIWLQPLPFPTIFKILYSSFLIILMLLPIIFPIIIIISYYAVVQYLVESALNIFYPNSLDVIHSLINLFKFQIQNEQHIEFLNLHMERLRYITTVLASCVDYMRLALAVAMN